jgi:3-methyladenine DNA glycosylase Tag
VAHSRRNNVAAMREVPPRVSPGNDNGYLDELTKAIFRSGFSWQVVAQK